MKTTEMAVVCFFVALMMGVYWWVRYRDTKTAPPATRWKDVPFKERLLAACAAVPAFNKEGEGEQYNYVFASQILDRFRKELFARGIILIPNETEMVHKLTRAAAPAVLMHHVTVKMELEITDCYGSSESITKTAFGVGMDAADKAIYKAKTGAVKYFLRILGLLPWADDLEVESDGFVSSATDAKTHEIPKGKTARQRILPRQVRAFDEACHKSGKTVKQISAYLAVKFDLLTVRDLARKDFPSAYAWARGDEDLAATLATSLEVIKPNGGPQSVVAIAEAERSDETEVG